MKRKPPPRKTAARSTGAKPVRARAGLLPAGYGELLDELKTRVRAAQIKAAVAANRELIQLYWDIGRMIVERQEREGWGQGVIEQLSDDVQRSFPGLRGFSRSNVFRMRGFYLAYRQTAENSAQPVPKSDVRKVPQPVGQLARRKVAQAVRQLPGKKVAQAVRQLADLTLPNELAEIPWGHNVLLLQKLADRAERLWYAEQAIAHGWGRAVLTAQIETDLYGRQGKAVTNFAKTLPPPQSDLAQPEFAGKMNFYLSTVDDQMRHPDDQPSIGLILCKRRDRIIAEYALRDMSKPIGVSEWRTKLVQSLPARLRGSLPTIEEIEAELAGKAGRKPKKK